MHKFFEFHQPPRQLSSVSKFMTEQNWSLQTIWKQARFDLLYFMATRPGVLTPEAMAACILWVGSTEAPTTAEFRERFKPVWNYSPDYFAFVSELEALHARVVGSYATLKDAWESAPESTRIRIALVPGVLTREKLADWAEYGVHGLSNSLWRLPNAKSLEARMVKLLEAAKHGDLAAARQEFDGIEAEARETWAKCRASMTCWDLPGWLGSLAVAGSRAVIESAFRAEALPPSSLWWYDVYAAAAKCEAHTHRGPAFDHYLSEWLRLNCTPNFTYHPEV